MLAKRNACSEANRCSVGTVQVLMTSIEVLHRTSSNINDINANMDTADSKAPAAWAAWPSSPQTNDTSQIQRISGIFLSCGSCSSCHCPKAHKLQMYMNWLGVWLHNSSNARYRKLDQPAI